MKKGWMAVLVFCFCALVPAGLSHADNDPVTSHKGKKTALSALFPRYEEYLDQAEKRRLNFSPLYRISMEDGIADGFELSFDYEKRQYRFAPDAVGVIMFRPSRAMLRSDPPLTATRPGGTIKLKVQMEVLAGLRLRYDVADLHAKTHDAWAELKRQRGFFSFLSAKHTALEIEFSEGCVDRVWSVVAADGEQVARQVDDGNVVIDFSDWRTRKARLITLSCVPARLFLN